MSENPKNLSSDELIIRNTYLNAVRSKIKIKNQNRRKVEKGTRRIRFDEERNVVIEPDSKIPHKNTQPNIQSFKSSFKGSTKIFTLQQPIKNE